MKCDDFLPTLETGGSIGRALARLHAGRCPDCAAVRQNFLAAKRRWAEPAALGAAERETWLQAARPRAARPQAASGERLSSRPKLPRGAKWGLAAGGLATAAAICVAVVVMRSNQRTAAIHGAGEVVPGPLEAYAPEFPHLHATESQPAQPPVEAPPEETTFAALEHGLDELASELDALAQQAALIDARRNIDHLLATYQPLGPERSSPADAN